MKFSVYLFYVKKFCVISLHFVIFQILDMTDSELAHLARHLGHDTKTHTEYYRLSHSTVQLSKVRNNPSCLIVGIWAAIVASTVYFVIGKSKPQLMLRKPFDGIGGCTPKPRAEMNERLEAQV